MEKQLKLYDVSGPHFARLDPGARAGGNPVSAPADSRGLAARLLARVERTLERRRQTALRRATETATVDDNWAGGWFARTWQSHESIFPAKPRDGSKPKTQRQNWDDRLD